jgi:hypothetical protein
VKEHTSRDSTSQGVAVSGGEEFNGVESCFAAGGPGLDFGEFLLPLGGGLAGAVFGVCTWGNVRNVEHDMWSFVYEPRLKPAK